MDKLMIIVPTYNEEEVLATTSHALDNMLTKLIDARKISDDSKILFVNDGSRDKTWTLIESLSKQNKRIKGLNFSRNFGHQNALVGGLTVAFDYGDLFITIDADLQDDVEAISDMIEAYFSGYDIVYGVRSSRESDTTFKRETARAFYRLMTKIGVEMVPNSADYRLMSKRAVAELLKFKEQNLFLRGIVPQIGFPSTEVYYVRSVRQAGESKYPLRKMLMFAWDGVTSFSIIPMRLILGLGVIAVLIAIGMITFALIRYGLNKTSDGWASLMVSIWFIGGVQLISVAVLGEYIGKVFKEVKNRPRFIIQDNLLEDKTHDS